MELNLRTMNLFYPICLQGLKVTFFCEWLYEADNTYNQLPY